MSAVTVDRIGKSFGSTRVLEQVDFTVERGQFVTLLGPSGCGKTTTLRCIAGLDTPDAGSISIAGRLAYSAERRINLKPEQRRLGMVFQSYAIWPHMTVAQNVAYGLKPLRVPAADIPARVARSLDMVGLPGTGERNVTQLSGGQQQRVALARSLVVQPEVLLLDEPLSNLDAKLRERMRFELKELQRKLGLTAIYVTHDQSEALALSDHIVVMERGRVVQQGSSEDIYYRPQSRFVLDFIGQANFLQGTLRQAAGGQGAIEAAGVVLEGRLLGPPGELGQPATAALRPEDVRVLSGPKALAPNVFSARLVSQLFLGGSRELLLEVAGQEIRAQLSSEQSYTDGQQLWLTVAPNSVRILP